MTRFRSFATAATLLWIFGPPSLAQQTFGGGVSSNSPMAVVVKVDVVLNHVEKTGRKTLVSGRAVCGDRILAEASVLFVQPKRTQT